MRSTAPTDSALKKQKFLTVAEVAAIARVSNMTIYRLVRNGELESIRIGRSFRIPEEAAAKLISGGAP